MPEAFNIFFTIEAIDKFSKPLSEAENKVKSDIKKTTEEHTKGRNKMDSNNRKTVESNEKVSSSIAGIGKGVATYLSFTALKSSFVQYAHFEKFNKKIQGIRHASNEEMKKYSSDIRKHQVDSLSSLEELTSAGFAGAKGGAEMKDLANLVIISDKVFTAVSSKSGETVSGVTELMTNVIRNFDEPMEILGDKVAWVIDNTNRLNVNEMLNSLAKSSPLARDLKVGFADMAISTGSISADLKGAVASTGIKGILTTFKKLGSVNIAKKLGLKEIDLTKSGGFIKFLDDVDKKFKGIAPEKKIKAISKVFTGQTGIVLSGLVDNIEETKKKFETFKSEQSGFVERSSEIQKSGANFQLKQFTNQIAGMQLEIGKALFDSGIVNSLTDFIKVVTPVISKTLQEFTKLSNTIGKFFSGMKFLFTGKKDTIENKEKATVKRKNELAGVKESFQKSIIGGMFTKKNITTSELSQKTNSLDTAQLQTPVNQEPQNINITLDNKSNIPLKVETRASNKNSNVNVKNNPSSFL